MSMKLYEYITDLERNGQCVFSTKAAIQSLKVSIQSFSNSLVRQKKKGAVATVYQGFHVIIPPEYRSAGCIPAPHFIPYLMAYLKAPYYTGLLSAAEYYGAAHQKPQIFQVISSKRFKKIICGQVAVDFFYKKDISAVPLNSFNVKTGYLKASSPEATAMDLLLYPQGSGGMSNVLTVLNELIESMDPKKLIELAQHSSQHVWAQRLGYLLEKTEPVGEKHKRDECIAVLKEHIQKINPAYVSLSGQKVSGFAKDNTWKIIINIEIESDI